MDLGRVALSLATNHSDCWKGFTLRLNGTALQLQLKGPGRRWCKSPLPLSPSFSLAPLKMDESLQAGLVHSCGCKESVLYRQQAISEQPWPPCLVGSSFPPPARPKLVSALAGVEMAALVYGSLFEKVRS